MVLNKASFLFKTLLLSTGIMAFVGCKKVHQQSPQSNTGRMLQVELKMPEAWKKIIIGPTHPIEYANIPQRFSMFMTGESGGALKPYLLIEDSTGKEYSILLTMVSHANKSQTEIYPVKCIADLTRTCPFIAIGRLQGTKNRNA